MGLLWPFFFLMWFVALLTVVSATYPYCGTRNPPRIPSLNSDVSDMEIEPGVLQILVGHMMMQSNAMPAASTATISRLFRKLTDVGYLEEVGNGASLRAAYVDGGVQKFLPESLNSSTQDMFYFRSDDQPRTVQSGQALVSGMYPHPSTGITLIDWHTMDGVEDVIDPNPGTCPALGPMQDAAYAAPEFVKHNQTVLQPLVERLSVALGVAQPDVVHTLDCSYTHLCHGHPIPAGITPELLQNVTDQAGWTMYYLLNSTRHLHSGMFLTEVYNNLLPAAKASVQSGSAGHHDVKQGVTGGTHSDAGAEEYSPWRLRPRRRASQQQPVAQKEVGATFRPFHLYSGHDTGPIMSLLVSLVDPPTSPTGQAQWWAWPRYASMILLELYQNAPLANGTAGSFAVRMIYNGTPMQMRGCSAVLCPFSEFIKLLTREMASRAECTL